MRKARMNEGGNRRTGERGRNGKALDTWYGGWVKVQQRTWNGVGKGVPEPESLIMGRVLGSEEILAVFNCDEVGNWEMGKCAFVTTNKGLRS